MSVTLTLWAVAPPLFVVLTRQVNDWPICAVVPSGVDFAVTTLGKVGVTVAVATGPV